MKVSRIIILLFTFLAILMPGLLFAQEPGSGPDVAVPIDGGLSLLIAGGVAYGIKKVRQARKS